jgi:DNA repair protein REV1
VATKKAKPDGIFHLKNEEALEFMKNVQVCDLPGVGRTNSHKFKDMGIEICEQLQEKPLNELKSQFGPKLGQSLYNFCRGIDDRTVSFVQERKSVSAEVNYGIR